MEIPAGVSMTDEANSLRMFCYDNDLNMDHADPETQAFRGIVFDSNNQVISKAFGYTPMYVIDEVPEQLGEYIRSNPCQYFPSHEGALVRAFFHDQKWYLTTHRKLDAFKSYWGSRTSFGQMFLNGLTHLYNTDVQFAERMGSGDLFDNFMNSLNREKQYVFLVVNDKGNRIVCTPPEYQKILHVATFQNGQMVECVTETGVPCQTPIAFESFNQCQEYVNAQDPFVTQGLVVFMPNGKQLKLVSRQYNALFELRGNESSVMFRYLQIRGTHSEEYKKLYPDYAEKMTAYEKAIDEITLSIYKAYLDRFVSHSYVVIPQEEYTILSSVHNWYKLQRCQGRSLRVSLENVREIVNRASPTTLNRMVRRYLKNRADEASA